jgi:aminoglycoside phosphotransferase (APT) family kinase protein
MAPMHADEIATDTALVGRLVGDQFPQWADLPLAPVASSGTDNAIYRLGTDMCVRVPHRPSAAKLIEKECTWLPRLAPLPLAIPTILGLGEPVEDYPWPWSIISWIDGENATMDRIANPVQAANDLADFLIALQSIDQTGGPPSGPQNHNRGVPLAQLDQRTRAAIANLPNLIDAGAASALWQSALDAPAWSKPPVWVHGDLQSGNLLAKRGRLSAVIDFGLLGVGDPACDLTVAWMFLPGDVRPEFRSKLAVDDATWSRGKGWALYAAVIAWDYYRDRNPVLTGMCRHAIQQLMTDANA